MKIKVKHYDIKVKWSNDKKYKEIDETNVEEAVEAFLNILITHGYSEKAIEDYIVEKSEMIKNNG
jgi:DNA-binding transcriptional regulator YhcF (GntR family)